MKSAPPRDEKDGVWKPRGDRWTICVDFDGVLHQYTSPWRWAHTIPDPPVQGAMDWLHRMIQIFDVVILSTRCRTWRGRRAIRSWLHKHAGGRWNGEVGVSGIEDVKLSKTKPPALVYLDDRAIRFEGPGTFPTAIEIHKAAPWNRKRQP